MPRYTYTYLEQRELEKRWKGPWSALANLAFTLVIFGITWWIFQDPRGIMRFYTPYVGYNICRWWLIILIWMAYIFDFWPFPRRWVIEAHPLKKGLVLTFISAGLLIMITEGFFKGGPRQHRLCILQSRPASEAAWTYGVLCNRVRCSGLHDVRCHRILDQPGMARCS